MIAGNICPKKWFLIVFALLLATTHDSKADASVGLFYYQQGTVVTKVDSVGEYRAPYFPAGTDLLWMGDGGYFQIGMDLGGHFVYDLISLINEDAMFLDQDDYGMDESFCNFKMGVLKGTGALALGYGGDLDWRVNKYRDINGASASLKKIRVGLGPNLSLAFRPSAYFSVFPNISGYFYPWPNADYAFIPKSFSSFGYRLEVPIILDLIPVFFKESKKEVVLSAMPFVGSKSGFFSKNDQTNVVKEATADVWGVKFGFYMVLDIFNFTWN